MSPDNLLSLKDDMVAFIEGHGLVRLPGYVTEDIPSIVWEGEGNPDAWKDFVELNREMAATCPPILERKQPLAGGSATP